MEGAALEVDELSVDLLTPQGAANVIDRVSIRVAPGASLGIIGESASGKTLLSLAVVRLLPEVAWISGGHVRWGGQDLLTSSAEAVRAVRGRGLGIVFQEPVAALNPLLTVGQQLIELFTLHRGADRARARTMAMELLTALDVPEPASRLQSHPAQLSKGEAQRVLVALGLAAEPHVLIADEPTASQDRERRERVLAMLDEHRQRRGMALVLISHELGVVREHADEIAVLHRGQLVERAPSAELFAQPQHPYTLALLNAERVLHEGTAAAAPSTDKVRAAAASPRAWPSGCRYRDRCARQTAECAASAPPLTTSGAHGVACYHPGPGP